MMNRPRTRRGARGVPVALVLLCTAAPLADAQTPRPDDTRRQRSAFRQQVQRTTRDFRGAIEEPPRPRRELRPCESMYDDVARQIARGPEPVRSHARWLRTSYELIRDTGPLPLCFEHMRDTLTSSQGRRLLEINNLYLRNHSRTSYWLTGFTDPMERDTALARLRAEEVHMLSEARDCHRARPGQAHAERRFHRRVYYFPLVPGGCGPHARR